VDFCKRLLDIAAPNVVLVHEKSPGQLCKAFDHIVSDSEWVAFPRRMFVGITMMRHAMIMTIMWLVCAVAAVSNTSIGGTNLSWSETRNSSGLLRQADFWQSIRHFEACPCNCMS
jgi:hypothetical protein